MSEVIARLGSGFLMGHGPFAFKKKLLVRKFIFWPIFAIIVRGLGAKQHRQLAGVSALELEPRNIAVSRSSIGTRCSGLNYRVEGILGIRKDAFPGSFWLLPARNSILS